MTKEELKESKEDLLKEVRDRYTKALSRAVSNASILLEWMEETLTGDNTVLYKNIPAYITHTCLEYGWVSITPVNSVDDIGNGPGVFVSLRVENGKMVGDE